MSALLVAAILVTAPLPDVEQVDVAFLAFTVLYIEQYFFHPAGAFNAAQPH